MFGSGLMLSVVLIMGLPYIPISSLPVLQGRVLMRREEFDRAKQKFWRVGLVLVESGLRQSGEIAFASFFQIDLFIHSF
jgi:hypothetical protein